MLFKVSLLSAVVVLGHFAHASENVTPFNEGARLASLFPPGAESSLADISLAAAVSCDVGKKACNNKCTPFSGNCCLQGGYCESGNYCIATGCCPIGRTCSGSVRECASGKVDCNDGCMPAGADCFSCFANNDVAQGSVSPDADAGFDEDFVYNFTENVVHDIVHDIVHIDSDPSRWCDPDAHQFAGNRSVRRDANTGNPGVSNSDPV
ncbi:hypothetical protein CSOJ01_15380 [Colletotrichum sojae]|uniref:Uncharacterized protein n=1 Tax=Colletotrichum sojae TaxID=2175907 RepID=A0A8H6IMN8_9PEZI|nr:hypothetical protein CSOJ01_15380 [Colletotrichum sojae]